MREPVCRLSNIPDLKYPLLDFVTSHDRATQTVRAVVEPKASEPDKPETQHSRAEQRRRFSERRAQDHSTTVEIAFRSSISLSWLYTRNKVGLIGNHG